MAGESVDLGQRFHDKAGVVVINKITDSIDGIEPGAVGVLIIEDKVQVSLRSLPSTLHRGKICDALVSRNER